LPWILFREERIPQSEASRSQFSEKQTPLARTVNIIGETSFAASGVDFTEN
jgi:hypothetical protein